MGELDREASLVWRALRLLRTSLQANDTELISEARFDLECYAACFESPALRERCTRALIDADNLPTVAALPA